MLKFATAKAEENGGGVLVITEGVFGMAGDLGNLPEIVKLRKEYKFRLLIDDAHGFGTMGKTGAGTDEHFGVQNEVDIYFSTFAKSMAGIGAFVAGKKEIIDYLKYNWFADFCLISSYANVLGASKMQMLRRANN
jgi:glycine C-acetyltransferase